MRALAAGAGEKAPKAAARAQAMYECWMEEQEENNQPEDIKACRSKYDAAMTEVNAAMQVRPVAAPAVPPPSPAAKPAIATGPFIVFFDFDSAKLSDQAKKTIGQAGRCDQGGWAEQHRRQRPHRSGW